MNLCSRFYRSTVGKKVIMAVTGLVLVGFVIGHMAGNLKAFMGFDAAGVARLDHYAVFLREMGSSVMGYGTFLWLVRAVLFGATVLHVLMAIQLVKINQESRSTSYAVSKYHSATAASRTMAVGGSILLFFIFFHILHFTTGQLHRHGFVEGHVYANVYYAFQSAPMVAAYLIAMAALCLHLYHGTWSVFQTLGIEARGWNACFRSLAKAVAVVVCAGFIAVPLAVYFHQLPPPTNHFIQHAE